jgi:hypothetical protein
MADRDCEPLENGRDDESAILGLANILVRSLLKSIAQLFRLRCAFSHGGQTLLLGETDGLCIFFDGSRRVADVSRLDCHRAFEKCTAFDSADLITRIDPKTIPKHDLSDRFG